MCILAVRQLGLKRCPFHHQESGPCEGVVNIADQPNNIYWDSVFLKKFHVFPPVDRVEIILEVNECHDPDRCFLLTPSMIRLSDS